MTTIISPTLMSTFSGRRGALNKVAPEPSRPSLVPVLPFLVKPVPSAENAALLEKPSLIIPHDDDKDPLAGGVDSTSEV
jgi:hypothetical protein